MPPPGANQAPDPAERNRGDDVTNCGKSSVTFLDPARAHDHDAVEQVGRVRDHVKVDDVEEIEEKEGRVLSKRDVRRENGNKGDLEDARERDKEDHVFPCTTIGTEVRENGPARVAALLNERGNRVLESLGFGLGVNVKKVGDDRALVRAPKALRARPHPHHSNGTQGKV